MLDWCTLEISWHGYKTPTRIMRQLPINFNLIGCFISFAIVELPNSYAHFRLSNSQTKFLMKLSTSNSHGIHQEGVKHANSLEYQNTIEYVR